MHMKKHLLTLCCALAIVLSIQSCSDNDDEVEAIKGDVEFKDVTLPQVKATVQGFWRLEKKTLLRLDNSSETEIDGIGYHNLGFNGDQVIYVNTDPAVNSIAPEWEDVVWGTEETIIGTLPFYIPDEHRDLIYVMPCYLIGIRKGMLVTTYLSLSDDESSIYCHYYSRINQ